MEKFRNPIILSKTCEKLVKQIIDVERYRKSIYGLREMLEPYFPKTMLIINSNKRYVLFKVGDKEYKVICHEDDKFNWFTGFGLALSKRFGNEEKWKNAREYFRNKKTRTLDYKNYAQWCVFEYFNNDTLKIKELQEKVKEINEYGKVDL